MGDIADDWSDPDPVISECCYRCEHEQDIYVLDDHWKCEKCGASNLIGGE